MTGEKRDENAKPRGPGRPFPKGNKLGGRKPIPPDVKKAFVDASVEALDTLKSVMRAWRDTEDPKLAGAAVSAANSVMDRAHGRPAAAPEDLKAVREMTIPREKVMEALDALVAMRGET